MSVVTLIGEKSRMSSNVWIKVIIWLFKYWIMESSSWIKWWKSAVMSVLLTVLGWRDQCQLLYHKWWCVSSIWWNTQSLAACCRPRDAGLDSVNIYFLSCIYCTIYILHYVGFCREQFVSPFVCLSITGSQCINLVLTSWWRKSSNITVSQSNLISLPTIATTDI